MRSKWLVISAAVVVVFLGGAALISANSHKSVTVSPSPTSSPTPTPSVTVAATPTPVPTATPAPTKKVNTLNPAGLFGASYTRKLTDFTPWQDSGVQVEYRDFNADGVSDAFVWAKLPGTGGYSTAAVWTIGSDNQPQELWHLPDTLVLGHSTWSVNGGNGLVNVSLKSDGTADTTHTFHWQVSTTGAGFVLEPGA